MTTQPPTPDGAPKVPAAQGDTPEPEHRKVTFLNEVLEGLPGYGEPPPEVRKDRLPDQTW